MSGGCAVRLRIFDPPEWTNFSCDLDSLPSLFYIVRRQSADEGCDRCNRKYLNCSCDCAATAAGGPQVMSYESDRRKISESAATVSAWSGSASHRGSLARDVIQRAHRGQSFCSGRNRLAGSLRGHGCGRHRGHKPWREHGLFCGSEYPGRGADKTKPRFIANSNRLPDPQTGFDSFPPHPRIERDARRFCLPRSSLRNGKSLCPNLVVAGALVTVESRNYRRWRASKEIRTRGRLCATASLPQAGAGRRSVKFLSESSRRWAVHIILITKANWRCKRAPESGPRVWLRMRCTAPCCPAVCSDSSRRKNSRGFLPKMPLIWYGLRCAPARPAFSVRWMNACWRLADTRIPTIP